jgi:hypothetical protein
MGRHHAGHRRAVVGALIHELLRTGKIDLDYLIRYTNAPWLVIDARRRRSRAFRARRGGRAAGGRPDERQGGPRQRRDVKPALKGAVRPAGRAACRRPVFELMAQKYLDRRNTHPPRWRSDRDRGRHHHPHRRRDRQAAFEAKW